MADILVERFEAWSSAIFISDFPDGAEWQQQLSELICQQANQQTSPVASNIAQHAKHQVWESELNFLAQHQQRLAPLIDFFQAATLNAAYELNADYWPPELEPEVDIVESWYHLTPEGGFHDAHSHPNCSWCGIYYVDAGESSLTAQNGMNRFYDPRHNAAHYQDIGTH